MAKAEWFAELVQYLRDHEQALRALERPSLRHCLATGQTRQNRPGDAQRWAQYKALHKMEGRLF